jgi:hypothetical protein
MKLVLAASEQEALSRVAAESGDEELISYRNAFEPTDVFTWSWQTWSRDDVETSSARRARAIAPVRASDRARFWGDVVPHFKLDPSFDYDGQPDIMLGYLKAYDRAMEA